MSTPESEQGPERSAALEIAFTPRQILGGFVLLAALLLLLRRRRRSDRGSDH
jgi:MYXO-CTERM domain-containing protein